MRRLTRKNIIISILSVTILIMTVVYASNSKQLDISGVSKIDSVWQVEVTNIETVTTNGLAKNIDEPYYEEASAYFTSSVSMPGDLLKYKVTVSNNGTMDAKLISVDPTLETDGYVDYEVTGIEPAQILKANESTDFYVSVFYDLNATGEPTDKKVYNFQLDLLYEQNVESGGTVVDTTKPTITLASSTADGLDGWYKTEPEITVTTGDSVEVVSYTYCLTNSAVTCTPNVSVAKANGTISNTLEGENSYVCAYSTSIAGVNSEIVCEGPYDTDFTAPKLNIPENKVIDITETSFDKMLNVSATDNITPNDDLNIIVTGDITFGTKGIYTLTYEVTDNVGLTTTKTRTVRVADLEQPVVTLSFDETQYNSNGWVSKPTIQITASDNSSVVGYAHCSSAAECITATSGNEITPAKEITSEFIATGSSKNLYICAKAFDDEGRTSDNECIIVKNVDSQGPTITLEETTTTIDTTVTEYDLMTGVTYKDNLTSTAYIKVETTGTLSLGKPGTYEITYKLTDLAGNVTTATKTIIIEAAGIMIANEADLKAFAETVNAGTTYAGETIYITDTITLTEEFTPIGINDGVTPLTFEGTIEGQGNCIQNISINSTSDYVGLFSKLNNATINDLCIKDSTVIGNTRVGALAGTAINTTINNVTLSDSTIEGVEATGGIIGVVQDSTINTLDVSGSLLTFTGEDAYSGGVIGIIYDSTITSPSINSSQIIGTNYIGGIIGQISGTNVNKAEVSDTTMSGTQLVGLVAGYTTESTITGANVEGTITNASGESTASETNDFAGITGYLINYSTIDDSYANISINGNTQIGGMASVAQNSTIKNSYADIYLEGELFIGGIVAVGFGGNTITNSFTRGKIDGSSRLGGILGVAYAENETINNCYSSIDMTTATSDDQRNYWAGGLAFIQEENATIKNSFATGSSNNLKSVAGAVFASDITTITVENLFASFDMTGTDLYGTESVSSHEGTNLYYSSNAWTINPSTDTQIGTAVERNTVLTASWFKDTLGLGNNFKYTNGYYPQVYKIDENGNPTTELVGGTNQTLIPIKAVTAN